MSDTVLPLRFVNTPTVKELWEAEHGKELATEVADEDVNEVSREYDRVGDVTGTESFYKLVFQHTQEPFRDMDLYSGNEGFWEGIKKGIGVVVDNIKKFFKWIFSFFTSKKELVDRSKDKMDKVLDVKGVKEGEITYPKTTSVIWNATGKPGDSLSWLSGKMTTVNDAIKHAKKYQEETKAFFSALSSVLIRHGQISKAMDDVDGEIAKYVEKTKGIFKEGPFIGLTVLSITKDAKIVLKRNPQIPQKDVKATYKTNVTMARDCLVLIENTNTSFGEYTGDIGVLEEHFVKALETGMRTGTDFELANEAAAKAVVEKIKKSVFTAMANIKTLETTIYKSINAALLTVKAAIPEDSGSKEGKE